MASRSRQWILVDADDTLWENNIYFERAIDRFVEYLDHPRLSRDEVRNFLNEVEHANTKVRGYGTASFGRNMQETLERLAPERAGEKSLDDVAALAREIAEHAMEILAGVEETLGYLAQRHHLAVFTKGNKEEQHSKVERSGLGVFFQEVRVVPEKNVAAYRELLHAMQVEPAQVWMVGNSPRSDINPALAAGMNAVWVPHNATWVLEKEEIVRGRGNLLVLERFAELQEHF